MYRIQWLNTGIVWLLRVLLGLTGVLLIAIFSACSISMTPVFGDGLFEEKLSAALGDRKANLIIKMTPPVVTTETLTNKSQNPLIEPCSI